MNKAALRTTPEKLVRAYAELQVTTNFSFLRGGSHGEEFVTRAKELGHDAIAVTDRNTLAGVVRAHGAAKKAGIKLIVGARLDLVDAPSLLCLPMDRLAYGRLSSLISLGQRRAAKGACELYLEDVAAHAQGQIFIALPPEGHLPEAHDAHAGADITPMSGTPMSSATGEADHELPAGEKITAFERDLHRIKSTLAPVSTAGPALAGVPPDARAGAPPDECLFLAAHHLYRGDDHARLAALAALAQRCGTPLVATNDVHYHVPARRPLQDVLTCIREGTTIHEAGFKLNPNAERYLKSPAQMTRLFAGYDDAITRTVEIASACNFSLDELVYEYPDEPVPKGKKPQDQLEDLTWTGAAWRFPDGIPDKVEAILKRELALIDELAYAPYFLTVHDIVSFARAQNILCQGRGSAANSAVCYCLGITAVNPVEIDLLFDRFISPERKEPPDIDVDFEHERREEVIQYIYARFGRDKAGLAATVISYRARSAVRDVGKAMGLSGDTVAALAGMVWGSHGSSRGSSGGSKDAADKHVREAGLDPGDPLLAAVLTLTRQLIGFPRHLSQHVGGFVLTRRALAQVVPVGNAAMKDRTVIEWDKDDLDTLGLLKVDILALGMLSCIHKAFDLLEMHHDRPMTLAKVPREDAAVYDMLCRADSLGVFQVESRAQMNMLPRLKPRCFYDLVIEVAIVRPGPIQGDMVHPYLRRRDGLEREDYPSPAPEHGPPDELRQILGKTKGVPLFQEQAMRIAMVAARFSAAEANELRKAMATFRRRGTIGDLEDKMVGRMVARGYPQEFATRCFNQIKGFGDYGFPESHAASFAHLVYVSSWLKCHYPEVFACALLNSQPMGFYAPAQIVRDAREHGVEVREVDVNLSDWDCTLEPGKGDGRADCGPALRLGMRLVDGLRKEDAEKIVAVGALSLTARTGDGAACACEGAGQRPGHACVPSAGALHCAKGGACRAEGAPRKCLPAVARGKHGAVSSPSPRSSRRAGSASATRREGRGEGQRQERTTLFSLIRSPPPRGEGLGVGGCDGAVASDQAMHRNSKQVRLAETHKVLAQPFHPTPRPSPSRGGGYGECSRLVCQSLVIPSACLLDGSASPPLETLGCRGQVPCRESLSGSCWKRADTKRPLITDIHDLWTRAGVSPAVLERLAAADAFRSLGLDRRQALWEVRGLGASEPLPLFKWSDTREAGNEPDVALPVMPLSEHVVNDYQTLRLSLKAHPLEFLREGLAARRIISCADLAGCADGKWVAVAGLVLVRQRPGSAKGVVFMTIEDETGIANGVVWAKTLSRFRKVVMGARLIVIQGRVQRHEDIIHVVASRLEDQSDLLAQLREAGPAEQNAQTAPNRSPNTSPNATRSHPRNARIIPKSRDFH